MDARAKKLELTSNNRVFRRSSAMASQKPFDYSSARRWAPNADLNDISTFYPQHEGVLPQEKLMGLAGKHLQEWLEKTPKSETMQKEGRKNLLWGIFGTYQKDWETPHLFYAKHSEGGKLWDVDGREYIDFNFGDTPSMYGHSVQNPAVKAAAEYLLKDGICTMMGNQDQIDTAKELAKHFQLPVWMHALTASDANRYVLSIARNVTGRPNIAMVNAAYHGTIDETQKWMPEPGVISRYHEMAQYHGEVDHGTKVFTWNDLESLEEVLADRSVACVIMEPVMSNFGWVWPNDDWHSGVKAVCEKYGTRLCYDETHTLSQGPNGMVGALGICGDFWTCGKAISSGIPGAVFGMTREIADELEKRQNEAGFLAGAGMGFLGNALTGNTMSTIALKVTLKEVLTDEVYAGINENAAYMQKGMEASIERYGAPFRVETMGNRLCYHFIPERAKDPYTGMVQIGFGGLFEFTHAYLWNHDMLIMPFFNMLLLCPQHTRKDIDRFLRVWDDMIAIIMSPDEG